MSFEVFKIREKGRALRALKEIETGGKVLVDTPVVCVLGNNARKLFCDNCFRPNSILLRCSGCKYAWYCHHQCQLNAWKMHKNECMRLRAVAPQLPTDLVRLMYRILDMKASNQDMSWYENLVSNVDQITEKRRKEFVAVLAVLGHFTGHEFIIRFESSEIIELFAKVSCNSFSICNGEMQPIGVGLYPVASTLNHSCNPNCVAVFNDTQLVIRAVRKIFCGDELTISYTELLVPAQIRQKELKQQYFFECCCEKCANQEDWLVNSYKCANKHCKNAVPDTGKCESCGTERDVKQILDICKYAKCILHEVEKYKIDPIKVMELCDKAIKQQEYILYPYHYLLIGTLDKAFDACISACRWEKALDYGLRTLEPYRHIYHQYHPNIGIQLFRIGKLQIFLEMFEPGIQTLQKALNVLKVTHGDEHQTVHQLKEVIAEASEEYRQKHI